MAFDKPNYTQIPNLFLDEYLPKITSQAEMKVTLIVLRYTVGFHERETDLTVPDLIGLTGLSRPSVIEGIGLALNRGSIKREKKGSSFSYSANIKAVKKVNCQNHLTVKKVEQKVNCSEVESLDVLKKERNINTSPQRLPRQPGSDDERNDNATLYKIGSLKDPGIFGYDIKAEMSKIYPSLPFTGSEDYYLKWYRSRFSTGGITGRSGGKATLEQYSANMENFFQICVENNQHRNGNGNGNGHKPVDDYRGPGRNTESDAARKKREGCPDCNGTGNRLIPVIDQRTQRETKVSAICKHENSTG